MYATKLIRYGTMCCALILAGTAQADQLTSTQEFAVALHTDKPNAPVSEELFVAGFDPALGTLNGISVRVDANLDGRWGVENLAEKERILTVGGGTRLALFAGANRPLMSMSANQVVPTLLSPFDGTEDWRGVSAEHGQFSATETEVIKFEPAPYWIKTKDPNGVPFTLELVGRLAHQSQMSGCIQANAKVSIRVVYHYDDGKQSLRFESERNSALTSEPIHAWREDRESSFD